MYYITSMARTGIWVGRTVGEFDTREDAEEWANANMALIPDHGYLVSKK